MVGQLLLPLLRLPQGGGPGWGTEPTLPEPLPRYSPLHLPGPGRAQPVQEEQEMNLWQCLESKIADNKGHSGTKEATPLRRET